MLWSRLDCRRSRLTSSSRSWMVLSGEARPLHHTTPMWLAGTMLRSTESARSRCVYKVCDHMGESNVCAGLFKSSTSPHLPAQHPPSLPLVLACWTLSSPPSPTGCCPPPSLFFPPSPIGLLPLFLCCTQSLPQLLCTAFTVPELLNQ